MAKIRGTLLIPLLLSVLLLPRLVVALLCVGCEGAAVPWRILVLLLLGGLALSVLAIFYTTINRPSRADAIPPGVWWRERRGQGHFLRYSLLPTVLAGLCLSTFWGWYPRSFRDLPGPTWTPLSRSALPLVAWHPPYGLGILLMIIGLVTYAVALALAFFDESQFESYGILGLHVVDALCGPETPGDGTAWTWAAFMKRVYAGHLSLGAATEGEPSQAIVTRLQGLCRGPPEGAR